VTLIVINPSPRF